MRENSTDLLTSQDGSLEVNQPAYRLTLADWSIQTLIFIF